MDLTEIIRNIRAYVEELPTDTVNSESYLNAQRIYEEFNEAYIESEIYDLGCKQRADLIKIKMELWHLTKMLKISLPQYEENLLCESFNKIDCLDDHTDDYIHINVLEYHIKELEKKRDALLQKPIYDECPQRMICPVPDNCLYCPNYLNYQFVIDPDGPVYIDEIEKEISDCQSELDRFDDAVSLGPAVRNFESGIKNINAIIDITKKLKTSVDEFLNEEPDAYQLLSLGNDLFFADIIDVLYDMFSGVIFKQEITKAQLLMILNLKGGVLNTIMDNCQSAASVLIYNLFLCYQGDKTFKRFGDYWDISVAEHLGINIRNYHNRKMDDLSSEQDETKSAYKWNKKISLFLEYVKVSNNTKQAYLKMFNELMGVKKAKEDKKEQEKVINELLIQK